MISMGPEVVLYFRGRYGMKFCRERPFRNREVSVCER